MVISKKAASKKASPSKATGNSSPSKPSPSKISREKIEKGGNALQRYGDVVYIINMKQNLRVAFIIPEVHKAPVCVVCDRFIIKHDDVKWVEKSLLLQHESRLGKSEYEDYFGIVLPATV